MVRRRHQLRSFLRGRDLRCVVDGTAAIAPGDSLVFVTLRNERVRLPFFLDYYRRLGVRHFLIVDNGSDDGSGAYLAAQPDVSLWGTRASYRRAHFGVDWMNHLLRRYGAGHWVLVVDPDELFVYPHCDIRPLRALTDWLEDQGQDSFPAMLLDLYPQGRIEDSHYHEGDDPRDLAPWFDAGNYTISRNYGPNNLWIQGGPRARVMFADQPKAAPALNKTPLVRWRKHYVFTSSTHMLLPKRLNMTYGTNGGERASGCLLHTKFLNVLADKLAEETTRREHFANSAEYDAYVAGLATGLMLWTPWSEKYRDWQQLEDLGLISRGGWL